MLTLPPNQLLLALCVDATVVLLILTTVAEKIDVFLPIFKAFRIIVHVFVPDTQVHLPSDR